MSKMLLFLVCSSSLREVKTSFASAKPGVVFQACDRCVLQTLLCGSETPTPNWEEDPEVFTLCPLPLLRLLKRKAQITPRSCVFVRRVTGFQSF